MCFFLFFLPNRALKYLNYGMGLHICKSYAKCQTLHNPCQIVLCGLSARYQAKIGKKTERKVLEFCITV